jgi:hypothetical protein
MIVFRCERQAEKPLNWSERAARRVGARLGWPWASCVTLAIALVFGCTSSSLCEGEMCELKAPDAPANRSSDSSKNTDSDSSSWDTSSTNTASNDTTSTGPAPRDTSTSGESSSAAETSSSRGDTDGAAGGCDPETDTGCDGATPWCLRGRIGSDGSPQEARCVECKKDVHCTWPYVSQEQAGVCVDHRCVRCDFEFNHGCPEETPYCVAVPRETEDGEHVADDGFSGRRCVECEADEHCTQPDASRCDVQTNTCVGCTGSEQCEHLSATPVCDVTTGECVQCTSEESAACDEGRVCNMAAGSADYRTCSDFEVASTGQCGECVNDDQCVEGYKCVPEQLNARVPTGKRHCMKEAPEEGCAEKAPFVVSVPATSLNGVEGRFCTLRYATCASYAMYKKGPDVVPEGFPGAGAPTCVNNDSCGLPGLDIAVCVVYTDNVNRCTYACFEDEDCPRNPPVSCVSGYCSVDNWRGLARTDYD